MLTVLDEGDAERVLTIRIPEATIDAELISALGSVLGDAQRSGIENIVLQFGAGRDSVSGDFPSWRMTCVTSPAGTRSCRGFPG
jgi:hypothetical protein